jgi:hypothetical protein
VKRPEATKRPSVKTLQYPRMNLNGAASSGADKITSDCDGPILTYASLFVAFRAT